MFVLEKNIPVKRLKAYFEEQDKAIFNSENIKQKNPTFFFNNSPYDMGDNFIDDLKDYKKVLLVRILGTVIHGDVKEDIKKKYFKNEASLEALKDIDLFKITDTETIEKLLDYLDIYKRILLIDLETTFDGLTKQFKQTSQSRCAENFCQDHLKKNSKKKFYSYLAALHCKSKVNKGRWHNCGSYFNIYTVRDKLKAVKNLNEKISDRRKIIAGTLWFKYTGDKESKEESKEENEEENE